MRYLRADEYDVVLVQVLRRLGLSAPDARRLIDARWPMLLSALPSEALGRGLLVTLDDVRDWVEERIAEEPGEVRQWLAEHPDGAVLILTRKAVEGLLRWAVETGRAKLNEVGERLQSDFGLVERRFLRPAKAGEN